MLPNDNLAIYGEITSTLKHLCILFRLKNDKTDLI